MEWSVSQIAEKHQRSIEAILYRLENEGFIDSWKNARGYCYNEYITSEQQDAINFVFNHHYDDNDNDNGDKDTTSKYLDCQEISEVSDEIINNLTDRVGNIEKNIEEITSMVKQILFSITEKKNQTNNSINKLYF